MVDDRAYWFTTNPVERAVEMFASADADTSKEKWQLSYRKARVEIRSFWERMHRNVQKNGIGTIESWRFVTAAPLD